MERTCENCIYNYIPESVHDYYVKTFHYPCMKDWGKDYRKHLFYLCTNPNVAEKDYSNDTLILKPSREHNFNGECHYFRSGDAEDIIPSTIELKPAQEELEIDDYIELEVVVTPFHKDAVTEDVPVFDEEGNPVIDPETGEQVIETIIIEPEFTNDQDITYKYQWYKNGRKLFKGKDAILKLNTKIAEEDKYFCEVTQLLTDNNDGGNKKYISDTNEITIKSNKVNAYKKITKIEDYLYETLYEELDYEKAEKFFETYNGYKSACSSVRNGNVYGRNYDWYYDDKCSFIVRTPAAEERFAVLGVSGSVPSLTKSLVETNGYSDMFRYMPFLLLDGINEKGVVCSINVVPKGDKGITTGTTPAVEYREKVNQITLVRYILDKFQTAEQAVTYIRDYVSVYAPNTVETHLMVADENNTFSLEFVNNTVSIREISDRPYMTNFYLEGVKFEDGHVDYETVTDYGMGLERFDTLADGQSSASSVSAMTSLMDSIKYTNAYDKSLSPFWYTEFTGDYTKEGYGKLKVTSDPEDFEPVVDIAVERYENRSRFTPNSWQTVHSSVYEIAERKLYIKCQEGTEQHEYTLEVNGD